MLPHRRFVEDHLRLARRGYFIAGGRILTDEALTRRMIERGDIRVTMWRRGLGNRLNALRLPCLSPLFYGVHPDSFSVRSCNLAVWREDMLRVNGYNEDIVGWGREDSELALRLMNSGVKKRAAKLAALAYHLWHRGGVARASLAQRYDPRRGGAPPLRALRQRNIQSSALARRLSEPAVDAPGRRSCRRRTPLAACGAVSSFPDFRFRQHFRLPSPSPHLRDELRFSFFYYVYFS